MATFELKLVYTDENQQEKSKLYDVASSVQNSQFKSVGNAMKQLSNDTGVQTYKIETTNTDDF